MVKTQVNWRLSEEARRKVQELAQRNNESQGQVVSRAINNLWRDTVTEGMLQITKRVMDEESPAYAGLCGHTEWLVNLATWDNPETLADWLKQAAKPGEYLVTDDGIWATWQALQAAEAAYEAEQERIAD